MLGTSKDQVAELEALAEILANAINTCDDEKLLPSLARQYRETLQAIAEKKTPTDDTVEELLSDATKIR